MIGGEQMNGSQTFAFYLLKKIPLFEQKKLQKARERPDERMDEQIDRQTDGRTDGQTDGSTDGHIILPLRGLEPVA